MKNRHSLILICAFLVLATAPAHAVTIDFSKHDDDGGKNNYSDGDHNSGGQNFSDWSFDDKDGKHDHDKGDDKGGKFSKPGDDNWNEKGPWFSGDPGKDGKDGWGDKDHHMPPPICAASDPGHHDKDGKYGWRFARYFKDLCDHGKNWGGGDPGHKHCDPGDPTPLPGSFMMLLSGLVLLFGFMRYKKSTPFAG